MLLFQDSIYTKSGLWISGYPYLNLYGVKKPQLVLEDRIYTKTNTFTTVIDF